MENSQIDIPEFELKLSCKTFLHNPIGYKATLYGAVSFIIAVFYAIFYNLLIYGQINHTDFWVICRVATNGTETVLREPGIALISTKALFVSMPLMTIIFAIISMIFIVKGKITRKSTGLFAIAFALSFFAIILILVQFQIAVDVADEHFWSGAHYEVTP